MLPSGGGSPDLYICFLRIRAAQLKPAEKTLMMASMAGHIEFTRAPKQLRQLLQPSNAAAKEDILRVTAEPASTQDEDLFYEARLAYKKGNKQRTGGEKCPPLLLQILWGGSQTGKR